MADFAADLLSDFLVHLRWIFQRTFLADFAADFLADFSADASVDFPADFAWKPRRILLKTFQTFTCKTKDLRSFLQRLSKKFLHKLSLLVCSVWSSSALPINKKGQDHKNSSHFHSADLGAQLFPVTVFF